MRRAKKEGRYMGIAPAGYINKITPQGKKHFAIAEADAEIMKWVFDQLADGCFNAEQIYKAAREKGIRSAKSTFWTNIRNPMYCGKIFIPKYKDEEAHFVRVQHEPLISESLFYRVQETLDGRKRFYWPKLVADAVLPLRGFLICPSCNKILTGRKSKGRSQDYFYYHCVGGCKCRYRAETVNELFVRELKKFVPRPEFVELYQLTLAEAWHGQTRHLQNDKKQTLDQIKDLEKKLSYLRELLSSQKIDPDDYRVIKVECINKLERLEARRNDFSNETIHIDGLLKTGIRNLLTLESNYIEGSITRKREIIGSIYPEKLLFDGFSVRTARLNEAVSLIYSLGAVFSKNKKGQNRKKSILSWEVTLSRQFSNHFLHDLKKLAGLAQF